MKHDNPWELTARQCDVMEALVEHGSIKGVSRALGIEVNTVENHTEQIRLKMRAKGRIKYLIEWDRWSRARPSEGAV